MDDSLQSHITSQSFKFANQVCKCGHTREYHSNNTGTCFGTKSGMFCPCIKFRIDRKATLRRNNEIS